MSRENPFDVLGLPVGASVDAIKARWRTLAKTHHPDHGGSADAFHRYRSAYNAALAEAAKPKTCIPCRGSGRVTRQVGVNTLVMRCDACKGTGWPQPKEA